MKILKKQKEKIRVSAQNKLQPKKILNGYFCEECGSVLELKSAVPSVATVKAPKTFYFQCNQCGSVYKV